MPLLAPIRKAVELPVEGTHRATIIGVADGGVERSKINKKERHTAIISYRLDQHDSDGEPMIVPHKITFSIQPESLVAGIKQSSLHKLITVGLGIEVPKSGAFDLEQVIGKCLNIKIQYKKRDDGTVWPDVVDYPKSIVTRQQVFEVVEEGLCTQTN